MQKLTFERLRGDWFASRVDGRDYAVEHFSRDDARLMARHLQGWVPGDLGLERAKSMPVGKPIAKSKGVALYVARRVSTVLVTLPGGSRPEVDAQECTALCVDAEDAFPGTGVAVAGLDEGVPVLLADISLSRNRVFWDITLGAEAGARWEFVRAQYEAAIRGFLEMLGEEPVLISDEEWAAPPATRVVPI